MPRGSRSALSHTVSLRVRTDHAVCFPTLAVPSSCLSVEAAYSRKPRKLAARLLRPFPSALALAWGACSKALHGLSAPNASDLCVIVSAVQTLEES